MAKKNMYRLSVQLGNTWIPFKPVETKKELEEQRKSVLKKSKNAKLKYEVVNV